jgi:hypothetical protein
MSAQEPFRILTTLDTGPITNHVALVDNANGKFAYYHWRKEYSGLRTDQAKRLKELEKENARLMRLLADAELDKAILKEAASGNF